MCALKKYGLITCIILIVAYFILRCFAYDHTQIEYVKKDLPIILFDHKNNKYVSITTFKYGKEYETFYVYDNEIPVTLSIPKENVRFSKNDTITKIYMEYVCQYIQKSKMKPIFKDKYIDIDSNEIYAIVHIPNNYVVK